jgi:peroxiredoxin
MMRTFFRSSVLPLLSLLAISTGCSKAPEKQPTVVSGRITNPLDSVVTFTHARDLVSFAEDSIRLRLDKQGHFTLKLDTLTQAGGWSMLHGDHSFSVFLEPQDSQQLTMDGKQPEETLRYSGRGRAINNYLAELDRQHMSYGFFGTPLMQNITHADTLRRRVEAYRHQRQQLLQKASAKAPLSPAARQYARFETEYDCAYTLLNYPEMYSYQAKKPLPGLQPAYYDFLKQLAVPQDSALRVSKYTGFLSEYVTVRAKQDGRPVNLGKPEDDSAYSAAVQRYLGNSRSRDFTLARTVYELMVLSNAKRVAPLLAEFHRLNRDSAYAQLIRAEYNNRQKVAPGKPAPEFALADSSGRTVSLSSFRGKAVYLDLWATWCGPCMAEMQVAPKLYTAMAGRDVVFVAISLDDNEQAWRRWLRKNAASGVVYLHAKGMNAPIAQAYQVKGIPSYWLIGPDGRIADNAPPRPSELQKAQKAIEAVLPTRTAVASR